MREWWLKCLKNVRVELNGNDIWNKYDLSIRLNECTDGADLTLTGSAFYTLSSATMKERSPNLERVLGSGGSKKKYLGPSPSSFGRQQRLSEITIEPIKNFGGLGKMWGPVPPGPNIKPPPVLGMSSRRRDDDLRRTEDGALGMKIDSTC